MAVNRQKLKLLYLMRMLQEAVSYTHLDVYKRQTKNTPMGKRAATLPLGALPVAAERPSWLPAAPSFFVCMESLSSDQRAYCIP